MKKLYLVTLLILQLALATKTNAQNVGINATSSLPDNSAMLDVSSTDKGFLAPRLTTIQQNAISLPAAGLLIFNTTDNVFKVNTGSPAVPLWTSLAMGSGVAISSLNGLTGITQTFATGTAGTDFGIASSGTAHTFNIPTASAANRGALSASDWSIFNSKLGLTSLSASTPLIYNNTTGVFSINQANTTTNGYLSNTDWNTFNSKQTAINGTGFVKASGTSISYDNNTYLTSATGRTNMSLTTTGTSGAATYNNVTGVLNVPVYPANAGTVTSVAALTIGTTGTDLTSSVATGTTTPVITLNVPTASATNRGALSAADWTTFNGKQATISLTNTGNNGAATLAANTLNVPVYTLAGLGGIALTSLSSSAPLTYNSTTGAFAITQATTSTNGYLSSVDWNTFNNKGTGSVTNVAAITLGTAGTDLSTSVATSTTTPLLTLNVPTASATNRGALSAIDWATFNNKAPLASPTFTGTPLAPTATAGTNSTQIATTAFVTTAIGSKIGLTSLSASAPLNYNNTTGAFTLSQANTSTNGYLSNTDWNTFNGKIGLTTLSASGPLAYNNGTGAFSISQAAAGSNGYLSAADWNTFNSKGSGTVTSASIVSANGFSGSIATATTTPAITLSTTITGMLKGSSGALAAATAGIDYTTPSSTETVTNKNLTSVTNTFPTFNQNTTGNAATVTTNANLTGPITSVGNATSITNNAVTYAKMQAMTANRLLGSGSAGTAVSEITLGTGLSFTGSTLNATNNGTVTSVAALTLGTTGTDLSSSVATGTSTPLITLNVPTASASNRGALSAADWTTFNSKQGALTLTTTGTSGAATLVGNTLNIPAYASANTAWSLTGNAVTAGSHFLGSTNNVSLRLRTNNTERMIIDSTGKVGVGLSDPAAGYYLSVKDNMEIRRTATTAQMIFTNTSGSGNFRIGGDGGDIYWQGGGGQSLQMGSYWATVLGGDRQTATFPAFISGISGTSVIVASQRDASVALGVQPNSGSQTANLTEWRNSGGTTLSAVDVSGNVGVGTSTPNSPLQVNGAIATAVASVNSNTTLSATNSLVLVTTGNGSDKTITLPDASLCTGRVYSIKKIDNGNKKVIVDGNGSQTIDGAATYTLLSSQWKYLMIQSDGSNWMIISNN